MQSTTKQTLKIYWQHAWRYKASVVFLVIGNLITCGIDLYLPFLIKNILNSLNSANPQAAAEAIRFVWYFSALFLANQIVWRLLGYANNYLQPRVMSDLLNTCYEYLLGHSYGFFNNNFVGSIVTRVRRYQNSFERLADVFTWEVLRTFIKVFSILGVLFVLWSALGLITLVWSVLYLAVAYWFTQWKMPYDIQKADQDTKTTAHLADTLANSINLKLFTSQRTEIKVFRGITEKLFRLRRMTWDMGNHFEAFQGLAFILLNLGVMYSAIQYWSRGTLTAGDFALLVLYLQQLSDRLWDFGKNLRSIYESLADANEMTEMLMVPHEVVDIPNASKLKVTAGKIEFKDVSFRYQKESSIFRKFNIVFEPGLKTALVGPSGGGKTTIVKLLFRFSNMQDGQVLIDGQDISKVTQDSLRKSVSLVPQEPILFHRSLIDNIRYGRPQATDAEVVKAAKAAHAHEFISKLADGYKTFVGERGVKLSGGERQRVAIARAILKNAPILVLDEATSSLDSESESLIRDAMETLMHGKTTIVIAHRLSTIMSMDRIIVIEDGKVTEEGRHEELVKAKEGTYQRLWEIQAGGFAIAK